MKLNEAFPSQYIKAADLQGRQVSVKIDRVEQEVIGNDKKLVIYFQGKERGMVLNRTNANNIAHIYGDEMDEWRGAEIVLFEAMVDFQGKTVPAIRVRAPQKKTAAAPAQQRKPEMADTGGDPRGAMDDEIPF